MSDVVMLFTNDIFKYYRKWLKKTFSKANQLKCIVRQNTSPLILSVDPLVCETSGLLSVASLPNCQFIKQNVARDTNFRSNQICARV